MAEQTRKVVCVEDEQEMIDLIRLILSRRGCEVLGANGGVRGLELIRAEKPDIVLLRRGDADNHPNHRGFSRTVRTQKSENPPRSNFKAQILNRRKFAESFRNIFNPQCRLRFAHKLQKIKIPQKYFTRIISILFCP